MCGEVSPSAYKVCFYVVGMLSVICWLSFKTLTSFFSLSFTVSFTSFIPVSCAGEDPNINAKTHALLVSVGSLFSFIGIKLTYLFFFLISKNLIGFF